MRAVGSAAKGGIAALTNVDGLSLRERRFLSALFAGKSQGEAYAIATAGRTTKGSARELGSRMLRRIKKKDFWASFLEAADLGDVRLLKELNNGLKATRTEFYQGRPVAECEDNSTRMRAVELLAKILGRTSSQIEVVGTPDQPLRVKYELANLSDEELRELKRLREKAAGHEPS